MIRRVQERDIPAVAALEAEAFPEGAGEEQLRRMLSDGRHVLFLAEEEGTPAGHAWYEFVLDEGYVGNVAVTPSFRRRGLGRALTKAMLADAKESGLSFLTLEVRAGNAPARRLYESCGFQTAGARKNYYERPREDAVLMTVTFAGEEGNRC